MMKLKLLPILVVLSLAPFLWLLTDLNWVLASSNPAAFQSQLIFRLAGIAGFLGSVMFFWQILLGNRFVTSLFTKDIIATNQLHQFFGKYGTIFVLLHPLLMTYSYGQGLSLLFQPDFSTEFGVRLGLGRMALLLFVIIFVTSAILRGRIKYRPWLYIHYLSYPMMFLVLAHAQTIGTMLSQYIWLERFWYALMIAYPLILAVRLLKWAGFGKVGYELVSKKELGADTFEYRFKPLGRLVRPQVGQFCYLQRRRFREAHPFTVMEFDHQSGELVFGIKASGPHTHKLTSLKSGDQVLIDGPYGVFTVEGHRPVPKVLIAGGIGITPFVELVNQYGDDETFLIYSNSKLADAVKRDQLKAKLKSRYFDVVTQEKIDKAQIISGRLDLEKLKAILPQEFFQQAQFFLCGPKPFYLAISGSLKHAGVAQDRIHYEAFGL